MVGYLVRGGLGWWLVLLSWWVPVQSTYVQHFLDVHAWRSMALVVRPNGWLVLSEDPQDLSAIACALGGLICLVLALGFVHRRWRSSASVGTQTSEVLVDRLYWAPSGSRLHLTASCSGLDCARVKNNTTLCRVCLKFGINPGVQDTL